MPSFLKNEHSTVEARHQQHLLDAIFHSEVGQEKMDIRFINIRLLKSILAVSGSE